MTARDRSLDMLLAFDGQRYFAGAAGDHLVRFVVKQVEPTTERPHG